LKYAKHTNIMKVNNKRAGDVQINASLHLSFGPSHIERSIGGGVALRDGEKFDQRKRAIKAEWFVL
jgi:hypothetical protein